MPAISTITLNDGQGTPVSHDFVPFSSTPQLSQWVNREGATPSGYKHLTASLALANGNKSTNTVKFRFKFPKLEYEAASNTFIVRSTARISIDVVIPDNFDQSEIADLAAYLKNMPADAVLNDYVGALDPAY